MEFFSLPLLLCLALFTYLFIKKRKPQTATTQSLANDQNIPLPPGRTGWPLIGESLDYISELRKGVMENFVADRQKKYSSKVFRTSFLGQNMAILCGPEGNKFLFSNERKLVQVWFQSSIDKIFPKSISNSEAYSEVRRILPSFLKADALQQFVGVMDMVVKEQLQTDWDREQVKVFDMVRKFTLTLSCRLFLSIDDPKKVEKLGNYIEDTEAGILSVPINLPGTPLNRAIKASKIMLNEIEAVVKQRKSDLSEKKESPTHDMLSQMLLATDENDRFLHESDISSHLLSLLQGGYSTVNSALTLIMNYLSELPDVYDEVLREQKEIVKSKGPKELLNWEDIRKMKYSWNVAREVMRLKMPGVGAFREAISDFTYAGHKIPKGWKLHWIAHATHKNPEYFPDPEKFDPSRFEGNGPAPYTFVPFGGGPRMCPGNEYARLATLVFMHNVVTKFKWEKQIPNEKIFTDPFPRLGHGLPIRLYPHNL